MGIALAGLGTFDDSFGDDSVGETVCKPKGYASPVHGVSSIALASGSMPADGTERQTKPRACRGFSASLRNV
jgi:hypothetical protein